MTLRIRIRGALLLAATLGSALLAGTSPALAYDDTVPCGGLFWPLNERCRVVDVLDRDALGGTRFSSVKVTEAWNHLLDAGCSDVADVVVGGTGGEDGTPFNPIPGGFAHHLSGSSGRCVIVVSYVFDGLPVELVAFDDSVEHGRKALAVALNALDGIRRSERRSGPIRVWGHSKGAAIVESTWRMEARNRNTKYITESWDWRTWSMKKHYVDACPSNDCYYFGFGYPHRLEQLSGFSISRATASTWTSTTDGRIAKPSSSHREWHRLTTFTNLSDPIYECDWTGACAGAVLDPCHLYGDLIDSRSYTRWDRWNRPNPSPASEWVGDQCGDPR